MATGMVLSVAQTVFAALQSKELREMCSLFGYQSELEKLQGTFTTIKAVLLDVESKQQGLTNEGRNWVEKLKDAVYDADDLLDEFTTLTQLHKQIPAGKNKISKKVRRFFSRSNQLIFAFNTSLEIKKLRAKLDSIAKDRAQFGLDNVHEPVKRREETWSYVREQSIVGREADKEIIVGMLLQDLGSSNHTHGNISCVAIVGIGGMGKTTLAQLVFNDARIQSAFDELKLWVCVSEDFGMNEILQKMLGRADQFNREELHQQVRKKIEGKKYLLVLDDVWNENHDEWFRLLDFLALGARGSRVLVTSRSKKVAIAIGDCQVYDLYGLSEDNSWQLFKTMAFDEGKEQTDPDLVDIGKAVVKKCANVPLSITVIGSLLHGQDKSRWQLFSSTDLATMGRDTEGKNGDDIMQILKFSYYHLSPPLKSCFSFCALFPKDYTMNKEVLIHLWLAHDCLVPSCPRQSMQDVGEEYFSILLHRCFLQELREDPYGVSYKMHDLIHDLAQQVAGKESLIWMTSASHCDRKIRHLPVAMFPIGSFFDLFSRSGCSTETIRTFHGLYGNVRPTNVDTIISHCRRLRVLDLHNCRMTTLPSTIGKLLHVRYLNLSGNDLEVLPKSISKLHNLRILKLRGCWSLRELPKSISRLHNLQILGLCACTRLRELPEDLGELVNLRHLDITDCDGLTHMPARMDNLTCLHTLSMFVVGYPNPEQAQVGELVDLKSLVNLRGRLKIKVGKFSSYDVTSIKGEAHVLKNAHLKVVEIEFQTSSEPEQGHIHETVLEGLCPNDHDLNKIAMKGYEGIKLPNWASLMATSLPLLVRIQLWHFPKLQRLPSSLSQLRHLKYLVLERLPEVEYIEISDSGAARSGDAKFFPSLEVLALRGLLKLKGWRRDDLLGEEAGGDIGSTEQAVVVLPSFPCLRLLTIKECPSMTYFPPCPHVKKLELTGFNEALTFGMKRGNTPSPTTTASSSSNNFADDSNSEDSTLFLENLTIDNPGFLNSLFGEFVRGTGSLLIHFSEVENLWAVEEGFQRCASSLQRLEIGWWGKLKSVCGAGIEHLTNLQDLYIHRCDELDLEEEEEDGMPWKSLHSLSSLKFRGLPKLVNLPKGLQHLTALQSLSIIRCGDLVALPEWLTCLTSLQSLWIDFCPQLKSLPEAIGRLTSLTTLGIYGCDGLRERCKSPSGEDWPKICRIPHLHPV